MDEQDQSLEQTPPLLTIDGRSYNLLEVSDAIKVLVNDLSRIAHESQDLQFRLRQSQLSQQAYIAAIQKEIETDNIQPYRVEEQDSNGEHD